MKKIIVLNWAISKETSWHWNLFKGLHDNYGYEFTVISGRKHWEPRGGGISPIYEEEKGIKCYRIFKSIPDFKESFNHRLKEVVNILSKDKHDLILCFHQANLGKAKKIQEKLNLPIVLIVEQAFRLSGIQNGAINDGWKQKIKDTDLIISWSPQDKEFEERTKVKYLPFGGCFSNIENYVKSYDEKKKNAIAIYQGSITDGFKNQEDFLIDIPRILTETPIKKMIINGYPLHPESKNIIDRLIKMFPGRVEHKLLQGRLNVLYNLSEAFVGYCPVQDSIMCNFPIEAFGINVPMLMNKITYNVDNNDFFIKNIKNIDTLFNNKSYYEHLTNKAKNYYDKNHSLTAMCDKYHKELRKVG